MNKTSLTVPAGIRYISQWDSFKLGNFPAKCIINKVLPGCGFTRFCIESPWENVILCSPRKMLLQNKHEQHPFQTFLVTNEYERDPQVDRDLEKEAEEAASKNKNGLVTKESHESSLKILDKESDDPIKDHKTEIKSKLHTELRDYLNSHAGQWKILVTYDSFRVLKEVLEEMGIFGRFYVVIDEFQVIMGDARFKSSTEINFLYHLQNSHSALFVSATPMLEKYLDYLDEFKDLPYYELDWESEDLSRITRPDLDVKRLPGSIKAVIKKIITDFKTGKRDSTLLLKNGQPVEIVSNELVFYLNSVNTIIQVIKACGLEDSEVNILCSNTPDNQKRIWDKLKIKNKNVYKIGRVPLDGEPRKPFTFCTRTVYLGADFYSDCAKSYIFSDANSKYLSIDISQDLPQILGRQRSEENPWKNSATFFYKLTDCTDHSTNFEELEKRKLAETDKLLEIWSDQDTDDKRDSLIKKYATAVRYEHYSDDYVAINRVEYQNKSGKRSYKYLPVKNNLVWVAEKRAFDIQQTDYADRFSIFSALTKEFGKFNIRSGENNPIEAQVKEFFRYYDKSGDTVERLKLLCDVSEVATPEAIIIILNQIPDIDRAKSLFSIAGVELCKANSYAPARIERAIGVRFYSKKNLSDSIYQSFSVGQKIDFKFIKSRLTDIYKNLNYQKTPKATDLKEFFETRDVKLSDSATGKRTNGYELLKKLY